MKVIPYPPLTVLRLTKLWPHARKQGHEKGDVLRVGYYSKQDGLECVWLVDKDGKYDWAADADWIRDRFEVLKSSSDKDYFGVRRPRIGPLTPRELKAFTKIKRTEPNQALQHNDPSCHAPCVRTCRASRGRG